MNEHTDRAGIEAALSVLLTSAIEADRVEEASLDPARPMSARAFVAGVIPTRGQSMVAALVRSPVAAACRQAITVLGQGLYDIGGRELMEEVAGRVQSSRQLSILDHAWNGVGKDNDRWWA